MRIIIQDVKHLKLKQDLLWIGTATLVTVIIWVGYAIYVALHQSTIDPEVSKLLKPLNPSLDQVALSSLNTKFTPPEDFQIYVLTGDTNSYQIVPAGNQTAPAPATHSALLVDPTSQVPSTNNQTVLTP